VAQASDSLQSVKNAAAKRNATIRYKGLEFVATEDGRISPVRVSITRLANLKTREYARRSLDHSVDLGVAEEGSEHSVYVAYRSRCLGRLGEPNDPNKLRNVVSAHFSNRHHPHSGIDVAAKPRLIIAVATSSGFQSFCGGSYYPTTLNLNLVAVDGRDLLAGSIASARGS
jgi:hypothetical protein